MFAVAARWETPDSNLDQRTSPAAGWVWPLNSVYRTWREGQ